MDMNENNKWGIIYCPRKGLLQTGKRWEKIEESLKAHQVSYDYLQSESAGSVERLVKILINNGYKTIVIVGGDSALNDAVNCLMQTEKQVRDQIALGIIPNGMMNDFAHFWGITDQDADETIAWLKKRKIRRIDVGRIGYRNKNNEQCHRYFLNCINIGLVATIMNLRRQTRHYFGSRTLSFLFSFILMIFQRLEYSMKIHIDTEEIKRKVMTVCIGNSTGYGQTPNAVPYNGMLDVSVVYHPEMTQLFEGIYLFVRGKFLNHRNVHPYRTQELTIEEARHALVGIDGRLMDNPQTPFHIKVEQEVINLIIPS